MAGRRRELSSGGKYVIVKPMSEIRFGTDGWRAKMGESFTFANVKLIAQAYANMLRKTSRGRENVVLVNHDTRYLSPQFAAEAAKVLSLNRIRVVRPTRDAPAPAASLAIVEQQLQGGISFTASFNELIYNGIKLFDAKGAPLLPSQTVLLEEEIRKLAGVFHYKPRYADEQRISQVDVRPPYLDYVGRTVNLPLIRRAGMKIVVDCLYGTSRDYLDKLLLDNGVEVIALHNYSDSYFGGVIPSCSRRNLGELAQRVREEKAHLGLATDVDSDRFGIVDSRGRFLDANALMPPLVEYLITVRHLTGDIVKSLSTTDLIDRVAEQYQRRVFETPVGFKYVADMLAVRKAFVGIESTNGAALKGPVQIKDGILFNLLVAEMVAHHGTSLEELLAGFYRRFPRLHGRECDAARTPRRDKRLQHLLHRKQFRFPGFTLRQIRYLDGLKFVFNDSWLLIRESGTKGVIRIYAESPRPERSARLLQLGRQLLDH